MTSISFCADDKQRALRQGRYSSFLKPNMSRPLVHHTLEDGVCIPLLCVYLYCVYTSTVCILLLCVYLYCVYTSTVCIPLPCCLASTGPSCYYVLGTLALLA